MRKSRLLILVSTLVVLLVIAYFVFFSDVFDNTVGIKADGSVLSSIPIKRNGDLYTFTGNSQVFTIRRSNIVIEGKGFIASFIKLDHVSNVTIKNLQLETVYRSRHKYAGIALYLDYSSNNKIINCNLMGDTLELYSSHNNIISNNTAVRVRIEDSNSNTVSNNVLATISIELRDAANNLILRNNVTDISLSLQSSNNLIFGNRINNVSWSWLFINEKASQNLFVGNEIVGPFVIESSIHGANNLFYHNNFIDAWKAKYLLTDYDPDLFDNIDGVNNWNTINEGNYWSDYKGQDLDHDGIGDTPYIINSINQDNFPLINPIDIETEQQPQLTP